MTQVTRYVYDENGQDTILEYPVTSVVETWDGEIDASGLHIDDAYNIDNIQITDSNSTKLLLLLALIINIKTQYRLASPDVTVLLNSSDVQDVDINATFNGVQIKKCKKIVGKFAPPLSDAIYIQPSAEWVNQHVDLFPEVSGVTLNSTAIPYALYGSKLDNNEQIDRDLFLNNVFYIDSQNQTQMLNHVNSNGSMLNAPIGYAMYIVLDKKTMAVPILIAQYITSNYSYLNYAKSNGGSKIVITDFKPNQDSKIQATILFTSDYYVKYPRIIAAGRDNTSKSLCSSYENGNNYGVKPGDGGYLKVSYGNSSSWTNYTSISADLNKHTYTFNKNSFYRDNTLVGSGNSNSFTAEDPFTILGQVTNDSEHTKNSAKIYGAEYCQNDNLVGLLYPAKNGNVVGLHDVINDIFYEPTGNALTV